MTSVREWPLYGEAVSYSTVSKWPIFAARRSPCTVIPRETAEFDSDGLADARQWAKPTLSGHRSTAALQVQKSAQVC
jgi:hypothetical protein